MPMSALGQKQTCALQNGMSALPPIATLIAYFQTRPIADQGNSINEWHWRSIALTLRPALTVLIAMTSATWQGPTSSTLIPALWPCYNDCSSDVAEGPTLAGTIDYAALASALAGVLTLAIMIWIAYAGRSWHYSFLDHSNDWLGPWYIFMAANVAACGRWRDSGNCCPQPFKKV